MSHPLDRPIGSDLSFECFQRRARRFELAAPQLDSSNQVLHLLPSAVVQREAFAASKPGGVSDTDWAVRRLAQRQRRLEG